MINIRKALKCILLLIVISLFFNIQNTAAADNTIKVLDIETSTVIKELSNSVKVDKEAEKAIRAIKRVTVQANPVPKQGYLIKIPLTKSLKVENKWFEDIVNEVLLVYNPASKKHGMVILYTDENNPLFFDIEYDFSQLFEKLKLEI